MFGRLHKVDSHPRKRFKLEVSQEARQQLCVDEVNYWSRFLLYAIRAGHVDHAVNWVGKRYQIVNLSVNDFPLFPENPHELTGWIRTRVSASGKLSSMMFFAVELPVAQYISKTFTLEELQTMIELLSLDGAFESIWHIVNEQMD